MRRVLDLFLEVRRGLIAAVVGAGFACAGLIVSAPAVAVIPPPPPGAPAVESAPSSLVGLSPQLPPSVISASAAAGSRWKPEKAVGIDQMLLAGAVGRQSPPKAIFPMVSANDLYRDTSFMGGLLDFEFSEAYLGLTGADNTTNPVSDTASDPALLSDLASIEADHANGLARYHEATTANILSGGDEA